MPAYDYQCEKCGSVFETEHAMTFSGRVKCPQCGSVRTSKVFQAAGIQFKGSGFYVTDSSAPAKTASENSSDNGNTGTGCKSEDCAACPAAASETAKA
jgi:putative FmdB family regulatory protein